MQKMAGIKTIRFNGHLTEDEWWAFKSWATERRLSVGEAIAHLMLTSGSIVQYSPDEGRWIIAGYERRT